MPANNELSVYGMRACTETRKLQLAPSLKPAFALTICLSVRAKASALSMANVLPRTVREIAYRLSATAQIPLLADPANRVSGSENSQHSSKLSWCLRGVKCG